MNYLKSISLIIIVSLLGGILRHSIAQTNLAMLYILVVVITAVRWGKGPSFVCTILSVLIYDFFFVPPHFTFTIADTQFLIVFATLFIVAMVISSLTLKAKEKAKAAENREAQTLALYNLSKDLVKTINIESLLNTAISHLSKTFNADIAIFIKDNSGLTIKAKTPDFVHTEVDDSAAIRSFQSSKPTGWNTNVLPDANAHYLPLKTTKEAFGVLGVLYKNKELFLLSEQYRMLETFSNQISFTIERLKLLEEAQQVSLLREAEKLHTAFLNSISHDLRTPLVSISGSLSSLLQNPKIDDEDKNSLIETAYEESIKLNQLVGDLLNMARVEAGALHINKKPSDVKDLIGTTLKQMEKFIVNFNIAVDIPDDLPEIEIDFILIMKVITNILDNAVKYSLKQKEINITARIKDNFIEISISDSGIGIPASDLKHVFDKFYRVKRPQSYEGTGLGLSVCKGIVEAHNGKIWAENRNVDGTVIKILLPLTNKND